MKTLSTVFFCLFFSVSHATEVDQLTPSRKILKDSRVELNRKMNKALEKTANITNRRFHCRVEEARSRRFFYRKLDQLIGGFLWAKYEKQIEKDPYIEKRHFKKRHSIYRGLQFKDAFILYFSALGSVINLGGHEIGTDKLGHFIDIGKVYFDKMNKKGFDLKAVMEYGQYSEEKFFGLTTTGIFSYADLVANYEGLQFWHELLDGDNAYLQCEGGHWVIRRSFDWMTYVNEAWNETINCPQFRNERVKYAVIERARSLGIKKLCHPEKLSPEVKQKYHNTPLPLLNFP